jgi:hypothetical protein
MAKTATKAKVASVGHIAPLPPATRPHKVTKDMREHFARLSAKQPVDQEFRAAFMRNKVLAAHTHPVGGLVERDLAVRSVIERFDAKALLQVDQPVPGGVGYGVFCTPAFKTAWGHRPRRR